MSVLFVTEILRELASVEVPDNEKENEIEWSLFLYTVYICIWLSFYEQVCVQDSKRFVHDSAG